MRTTIEIELKVGRWAMQSTKIHCHCGRRLWWVGDPARRHWVPPAGRELEPDLIEDCTPGVAIPATCPEHRGGS